MTAATAPLVTLHGFTGCAADWTAVGPGGGAIRLSLIGHSPELPVPPGHDFAAEVARLVARIAAIGRPVHLAGYSMGARVALAVALAAPAAIERLTLVGVHPGLPDEAERAARRAADAAWSTMLRTRGIAAFVAAWEAQPLWATQRAASLERLAVQRAVRLAHAPDQLAAALDALGLGAQPSLGARLGELRVPTAFVAGALDDKFAALATTAAARAPRGRVVLIPGAGHNPLIEHPARVADVIRGEPQ